MSEANHGEIIVYQAPDGLTRVDVRFEDDTVWLSQAQLVELYQSSKANISEHIRHIFEDGELSREATVRKFRTVQIEGARQVTREVAHYNLDMIIAIGYRVRTQIGTQFRQWATAHLKEYMVKGFTLDDERLKGSGGGDYWKELLERIRDIRSSEKMLYRQVLDLYATSLDYDPRAEATIRFFQIVQNKLHFAAHGHTAAEEIKSLEKMPKRIKTVDEQLWNDAGIRKTRVKNYYIDFLVDNEEMAVKVNAVIYTGRDQTKQMSDRRMEEL